MRTLQRDKKPLKYSLYIEKDEEKTTDSEGNLLLTGESQFVYSSPVDFKANLVMSGSDEAHMVEYGLDMTDYDAIMLTTKGKYPIVEGSLIWDESKPKLDRQGYAVESSADYRVVKKKPTSNVDRYILKRLAN